MGIKTVLSSLLLVLSALCLSVCAQTDAAPAWNPTPSTGKQGSSVASPLVLGHGVGLFKVGPLLAQDDFEDRRALRAADLFRMLGQTTAGETGCHDHKSHSLGSEIWPLSAQVYGHADKSRMS